MLRNIRRIGLALLLVGMSSASAIAETNWDMSNEYPEGGVAGVSQKYFADKLNELSGGDLTITNFFGGALGFNNAQHFDAVSDGAVPIAQSFSGQFGGIEPVFLLGSLPFLTGTVDEAKKLWEISKPYYEAALKRHNQKLLYVLPTEPGGLWGKKPLDSLDAIKNVRIRVYDKNGVLTLEAAGASPVNISWADVIPQLSTGGIEGVLTTAEGGVTNKFSDSGMSHFTEINYAFSVHIGHMNLDVWNGLTPEQQATVMAASDATTAENWNSVADSQKKAYAGAKEQGVTVVTGVDKAYLGALREAATAAYTDWREKMGDEGTEILNAYSQ